MPRLAFALLAACMIAGTAHAADPVRITVIADLDDDIYDARSGRGGVDATRMAVADFGGSVLGRPVVVDALNAHNTPTEAPGLAAQAQARHHHRLGRPGADPGGVQQVRVSLLL